MNRRLQVGSVVPLRVAILFALETLLKDRLNSNPDRDFHVGTVAWGREEFGQDESTETVISFIEPPKPVDIPTAPQNSNVRTYEWVIYIQGMMRDTLFQPTYSSYEMVAEIKTILNSVLDGQVTIPGMTAVNNIFDLGPTAQRNRGNGNNISDIKVGSETVRGPGEHSRFAFFWLPVHFTITEDLKNPRVTIQDPL